MPRTFTAGERSAVQGQTLGCHARFEIEDPDGTRRDVTGGLPNSTVDWLNAVTITDDIDANTPTLDGVLLRDTGTLSLAPFRSDSLVNRNAGASYAPMLDLWRRWWVSSAVIPKGSDPQATDWKELLQGRMDVIDVKGDKSEIQITGRGEEAVLIDGWIGTERTYSGPMETVIQQMLDDNLGAGVYTLYTPVSPSFVMNTWTQPVGNLMEALTTVAQLAGFILRFRYDASNVNRLTLFKPNRTATVEDWSIGADEYLAVQLNKTDIRGVRTFAKITYADATAGKSVVYSPKNTGTVSCTAGAATFSSSQAGILANGAVIVVHGLAGYFVVSAFNGTTGCTLKDAGNNSPTFSASNWGTSQGLTSYKRRDIEIDLSAKTQVTNGTAAQGFGDAVVSDVQFPNLEQQFETYGFWFIQLYDFGKFLANKTHYDSDQFGGVTRFTHAMAGGTIRTTIGARGKPAGRYAIWRRLAAYNATPAALRGFAECIARITATSATQVTVTVTANPSSPAPMVQLVGITGGATLASGTAAGTWVNPNGTNNVWVFNRAAINGGVGQVQFRAGNMNTLQDDDDFVSIEEQGRDTVPLAMRARVTAVTPSTLTVRVAVADPYPQGAGSGTITYVEQNTGAATTPGSPQSVTPAATLTEVAGTFVDFTVTRPAFGAGAGRVTFTATASGRTSDSDAVDVPEVGRDTVFLNVRARVTATTPTQLTVRVAVADPYPQGAASASISYSDVGVGVITPAPPNTVTPDATLTENPGTYVDYTVNRPAFGSGAGRITFTVTAANRGSAQDAVDVPEVGRDTRLLSVRVTRISETASQIVVRVEARAPQDPSTATATVVYDAGGLSVSPASGGTFSATDNFATTGHIDYTITRDTQGGTPRRVAFTVTASGYIDGTDGVDVPPNSTRDNCLLGLSAGGFGAPNGSFANILWDAEEVDAGGFHSLVSNQHLITIPAALGANTWQILAECEFNNPGGGGYCQVRLVRASDSAVIADDVVISSPTIGVNTICRIARYVVPGASGDSYYLQSFQNSGGSRTIGGSGRSAFFQALNLW